MSELSTERVEKRIEYLEEQHEAALDAQVRWNNNRVLIEARLEELRSLLDASGSGRGPGDIDGSDGGGGGGGGGGERPKPDGGPGDNGKSRPRPRIVDINFNGDPRN